MTNAEHESRTLATGEAVHLVRQLGTNKWFLHSYDWTAVSPDGRMHWTARVTFQMIRSGKVGSIRQ
jgi:hypothetical protein